MNRLILISLLTLIVSCTSYKYRDRETFIRDTIYIKVPDTIRGYGVPQVITDTAIIYTKVRNMDTVVYIKYLPVEKRIEYVVIPDTVRFHVRDTIVKYNQTEKIVETPLLSKFGLVLLGIALSIIIIYFIEQRTKKIQ